MLERLKARAARHNRSLEAELRHIVTSRIASREDHRETRRLQALFAGRAFTDSAVTSATTASDERVRRRCQVSIKWFLPEIHYIRHGTCFRLPLLMVPDLFFPEFGDILWKKVGRDELTMRKPGRCLPPLLTIGLRTVSSEPPSFTRSRNRAGTNAPFTTRCTLPCGNARHRLGHRRPAPLRPHPYRTSYAACPVVEGREVTRPRLAGARTGPVQFITGTIRESSLREKATQRSDFVCVTIMATTPRPSLKRRENRRDRPDT